MKITTAGDEWYKKRKDIQVGSVDGTWLAYALEWLFPSTHVGILRIKHTFQQRLQFIYLSLFHYCCYCLILFKRKFSSSSLFPDVTNREPTCNKSINFFKFSITKVHTPTNIHYFSTGKKCLSWVVDLFVKQSF